MCATNLVSLCVQVQHQVQNNKVCCTPVHGNPHECEGTTACKRHTAGGILSELAMPSPGSGQKDSDLNALRATVHGAPLPRERRPVCHLPSDCTNLDASPCRPGSPSGPS